MSRSQRPRLAALLRQRAVEWARLPAPAAALADLRRARRLHAPEGAERWRRLTAQCRLELADQKLRSGHWGAARKALGRLRAARYLKGNDLAWRLAALDPDKRPLGDLEQAILRLVGTAPAVVPRLARAYLIRNGQRPDVLLASLRALTLAPAQDLARRLDQRIAKRPHPALWSRACHLRERPGSAASCRRLRAAATGQWDALTQWLALCRCHGWTPGDAAFRQAVERLVTRLKKPNPLTPPQIGSDPPRCALPCLLHGEKLPTALAQATHRARVQQALRRLGCLLSAWNLRRSPQSKWFLPLPTTPPEVIAQARNLVHHREPCPPLPPLVHALRLAGQGQVSAALARLRTAPWSPTRQRWLARLHLILGQRDRATQLLLGLRNASPGGVTHLAAVLHDLRVLGLNRPAQAIASELFETQPKDAALLRIISLTLIGAHRPELARLALTSWADHAGDAGAVYFAAARAWAQQGDGQQTVHWTNRLLRWRGAAHGPTLRAIIGWLINADRARDARRIAEWALAQQRPGDRTWLAAAVERLLKQRQPGRTRSFRQQLEHLRDAAANPVIGLAMKAALAGQTHLALQRLALAGSTSSDRGRWHVGQLAAAIAVWSGDRRRASYILAALLAQARAGFSRTAWLHLAALARGRRLSPAIPRAMLRSAPRSCVK